MTDQATRLAEEAKRQVTALASGLVDQQAMPDDWWINALSEATNTIDALLALVQPAVSERVVIGHLRMEKPCGMLDYKWECEWHRHVMKELPMGNYLVYLDDARAQSSIEGGKNS